MKKTFLVVVLLHGWLLGFSQRTTKNEAPEKNNAEKTLQGEAAFIEGMKLYLAEDYTAAAKQFKAVADRYDADAGVLFMLAKAFANAKDVPSAIGYAQKSLEKEPSNKYYQKFLADLFLQQYNYKSAGELYQKLAKEYPTDIQNYIALSNVYLVQEKFNDAIKVYDELEKNVGISEEISRQKQLVYLQQNKVDEAIREGTKLIEAEPLESDYVLQQAQLLISNERYQQAVDLLENALKKNQNLGEAHILLAEIYRLQNKTDKSYEELKKAFADKNLGTDTKTKMLAMYVQSIQTSKNDAQKLENATELTNQLLQQSTENASLYVIKGTLLRQQDKKLEALKAYETSINYDKSVFEVWISLIELSNELNDTQSLVKHATAATEYFPNQAVFWYYNGFGNFRAKNYEAAAEGLEEATNLAFNDKPLQSQILALLGDVYNELRTFDKSDKAYEASLQLNPDNEIVLNNYSYFLSLRKQKLDRAKELSKKLIEKQPENSTFLDTYAWVLFQKNEFDEARKFLEKAALKDPSGTILEHLGDVLYKTGEKQNAVETWKKAKQKGGVSTLIDQKITKEEWIE